MATVPVLVRTTVDKFLKKAQAQPGTAREIASLFFGPKAKETQVSEVEETLENLVKAGFLAKNDGIYSRTNKKLGA